MKKPLIIAVCLVLTACQQVDTATKKPNISHDKTPNKNNHGQKICQKMPPILDKTKLIAMLIKSGQIKISDTETVKLQKLERYVLNKRTGMAKKCK